MLNKEDRPVVIEISENGIYEIAQKISSQPNFKDFEPNSIDDFIDLVNQFYNDKKRVASIADRIQIGDLLAIVYLGMQSPPRDTDQIFYTENTDKKSIQRIKERLRQADKIIKTYS